jgi:hypothetical protein
MENHGIRKHLPHDSVRQGQGARSQGKAGRGHKSILERFQPRPESTASKDVAHLLVSQQAHARPIVDHDAGLTGGFHWFLDMSSCSNVYSSARSMPDRSKELA